MYLFNKLRQGNNFRQRKVKEGVRELDVSSNIPPSTTDLIPDFIWHNDQGSPQTLHHPTAATTQEMFNSPHRRQKFDFQTQHPAATKVRQSLMIYRDKVLATSAVY